MIRVMIADDHAIFREGLKQVINDEVDMNVTAEAASGDEALKFLRCKTWDVLVLDIAMPGKNILDLIHLAKSYAAEKPILILSSYPEDQYAIRMLRAGADGYLCKDRAPEELISALRKLANHEKYISSAIAKKLLNELNTNFESKQKHTLLSDREFQVFLSLAKGKRLTEVADNMSLSVKTISTYRSRLLEKLNLNTNGDLIHYAIKHELLEN